MNFVHCLMLKNTVKKRSHSERSAVLAADGEALTPARSGHTTCTKPGTGLSRCTWKNMPSMPPLTTLEAALRLIPARSCIGRQKRTQGSILKHILVRYGFQAMSPRLNYLIASTEKPG